VNQRWSRIVAARDLEEAHRRAGELVAAAVIEGVLQRRGVGAVVVRGPEGECVGGLDRVLEFRRVAGVAVVRVEWREVELAEVEEFRLGARGRGGVEDLAEGDAGLARVAETATDRDDPRRIAVVH
jgi:hypothetical protein